MPDWIFQSEAYLTGLVAIAGFILGVHLTILLFARCYALIDIGYCLTDFWLEVTARLAVVGALIGLVYLLADGTFLLAFQVGQIFFAAFHIVIFWLGQLLIRFVSP